MTAELCPTCGIWWRGVEHSCRLPIYSTSTAGLSLADTDPRDAGERAMIADPRLGPLAAALHRATCGKGNEHWTDGRDEPSDIERHTAAAILAVLPPDWCGHDPDDAERTALYLHTLDGMNAEIARLRDDLDAREEQIARQAAADGTLAVAFDAVRAESKIDRLMGNMVAIAEQRNEAWAEIVRLRAALEWIAEFSNEPEAMMAADALGSER